MKNKSIIIMTILSLVLIVGCCYRQLETMASNIVQGKVDDKKDTKTVKTKDYMYYCIYDSIYKVNIHTKDKSLVYKNDKLYWYYDLQVEDGWIYGTAKTQEGTDGDHPYIFRVRTNGKDAKLFTKGSEPIIYKGKIYYIKNDFSEFINEGPMDVIGIYRMSLDGKNDECIKKSNCVNDFTIYKSRIYYGETFFNDDDNYGCLESSYSYLKSMDLNGKTEKTISKNGEIAKFVIDSDNIYFEQYDSIYKININTSKTTKIIKYGELLGIVDGYLYYNGNEKDEFALFKMNLKDNSKTLVKKGGIYKILDVNGDKLLFLDSYKKKDQCYSEAIYLSGMDFRNEVCLGGYFTP